MEELLGVVSSIDCDGVGRCSSFVKIDRNVNNEGQVEE